MSAPIEVPATATDVNPATPRAVVIWGVAASLLLVGSGVAREIQAARHREEKDYKVQSPFPLRELPRTVGSWRSAEGSGERLDDLTTRITGSTDHILWKYKDEQTGTIISVLVLYGPAEPVVPHTPQVCYPATGYQAVAGPVDRAIELKAANQATFRAGIFAKSGGRDVIRAAVYHSFRLDGTWSPAIATQRFPRKNPGIFKVQVSRRTIEGEENSSADEPIEQFLREFLPVLERRIGSPRSVATGPTAAEGA